MGHNSGRRRTSLVDELQRSHRALVLTIAAMLLLNLVSSGYLLLVSQPEVARLTALTKIARLAHEGMLNEETGLRGWLATGDPSFLGPYTEGRRAVESTTSEFLDQSTGDPDVAERVMTTMRSRHGWQAWAARAADMHVSDADRSNGTPSSFLREGKLLFDSYRGAEARATDLIARERDRVVGMQRTAVVALPIALLVATAIIGTRARSRRRQLARTVQEPIGRLLGTIEALGSGDLTARAQATGVTELDAMGRALGALAGELSAAHDLAAAREQRLALLASRLEMVVRVAREVTGSVSQREVAEAVTVAAAELLGVPTTLYVRTEDGRLVAAHRSQDPRGRQPSADRPSPALVFGSAADARPVVDAVSRAYPLVLAGVVVGVLHVSTAVTEPDTEQVLVALLSTAAAALESARLNSAARDRADVDALTQLSNRRRMDADLEAEWERCRRYGRPLSFIMLDLDNFKLVNDAFGHLVGDATLRAVAAALRSGLRSTDSAYRYGGEEFAILLRETGLGGGGAVAENLRAAVAVVTIPGSAVAVTASLGLAERTPTMRDPSELVAAADAALYTAKRTGRDRVVEQPRLLAP